MSDKCSCPELANYAEAPLYFRYHDCDYARQRAALVPAAATAADEEFSVAGFGRGKKRREA